MEVTGMHQLDSFIIFSMAAIAAGILLPIWMLISDRGNKS